MTGFVRFLVGAQCVVILGEIVERVHLRFVAVILVQRTVAERLTADFQLLSILHDGTVLRFGSRFQSGARTEIHVRAQAAIAQTVQIFFWIQEDALQIVLVELERKDVVAGQAAVLGKSLYGVLFHSFQYTNADRHGVQRDHVLQHIVDGGRSTVAEAGKTFTGRKEFIFGFHLLGSDAKLAEIFIVHKIFRLVIAPLGSIIFS